MLNRTNCSSVLSYAIPILWDKIYSLDVQTYSHALTMGFIAILGIWGNIWAFIIFGRLRLSGGTSFLLRCLAIFDSIILLGYIWFYTLHHNDFSELRLSMDKLWQYVHPTWNAFRLIDTWLLVSITIDRYIAVCHPFKAAKLCSLQAARIKVVTVVVFGFVYHIPGYLEWTTLLIHNHCLNKDIVYAIPRLVTSKLYSIVEICLQSIFIFVLPMGTMIILGIRIIKTLLLQDEKLRPKGGHVAVGRVSSKTLLKKHVIISKMILVIMAVYLVYLTLFLTQMVYTRIKGNYPYSWLVYIAPIMELNYGVNIIIYYSFMKQFRHKMKQIVWIPVKRLASSLSSTRSDNHPSDSNKDSRCGSSDTAQ